jgi:hypothetical protein
MHKNYKLKELYPLAWWQILQYWTHVLPVKVSTSKNYWVFINIFDLYWSYKNCMTTICHCVGTLTLNSKVHRDCASLPLQFSVSSHTPQARVSSHRPQVSGITYSTVQCVIYIYKNPLHTRNISSFNLYIVQVTGIHASCKGQLYI